MSFNPRIVSDCLKTVLIDVKRRYMRKTHLTGLDQMDGRVLLATENWTPKDRGKKGIFLVLVNEKRFPQKDRVQAQKIRKICEKFKF